MRELILIGVVSVIFTLKIIQLEKRIKRLEDSEW